MRNRTVAVFGASGHTGRFVVSELRRRGWTPILSGRNAATLNALAEAHPGSDVRTGSVDDPASLDRAISGAEAVINCAGPFIDTAAPVIDAALRAGIHYLDVTAEQMVAAATFERYSERARDVGVVVAPSMAFYGGLGDLLATVAMGDWPTADDIRIAIALDSWKPTRGTRRTVQRNAGRHVVFVNNRFEAPSGVPRNVTWNFPPPFGTQDVTELSTADQVTIPRHLRTPEVRAYVNLAPLRDLRDPDTPAPVAADESGRSSQTFLVEAVARRGSEERRATARGHDIYAVTAPIIVEAAERILDGRLEAVGVAAAGEIFDAEDFLRALSPEHLSLEVR